jgi:hypothetical protein
MGLAGKNVQFVDAVVLGVNSPTVKLNNLPTLTIGRASADPQPKSVSFANNIQCVNFIAGMSALLQSATLTKNALYLFVNTGSGRVTLALDNGGTVGTLATYILVSGQVIEFFFDGTNLS